MSTVSIRWCGERKSTRVWKKKSKQTRCGGAMRTRLMADAIVVCRIYRQHELNANWTFDGAKLEARLVQWRRHAPTGRSQHRGNYARFQLPCSAASVSTRGKSNFISPHAQISLWRWEQIGDDRFFSKFTNNHGWEQRKFCRYQMSLK